MKPRPLIDLVQQRFDELEAQRVADNAKHAAEIAEVRAENRALWLYVGKSRGMTMTALVEIAEVRHFVGMEPPKRKAPVGLPVKQVAEQSGYSESGLRKMAKAAEAAGAPIAEQIGGRWFFDVDKLPRR